MADYLTKHEPVDDYPYICYAPDADFNTSDISTGGGGGGGGILVINAIGDEEAGVTTLDKTCKEIMDAFISNGCVIKYDAGEDGFSYLSVINTSIFSGEYLIVDSSNYEYRGQENDYPNDESSD